MLNSVYFDEWAGFAAFFSNFLVVLFFSLFSLMIDVCPQPIPKCVVTKHVLR